MRLFKVCSIGESEAVLRDYILKKEYTLDCFWLPDKKFENKPLVLYFKRFPCDMRYKYYTSAIIPYEKDDKFVAAFSRGKIKQISKDILPHYDDLPQILHIAWRILR